MKILYVVILMVLLCAPMHAQEQVPLKLPPEVRGQAGQPVKVKAETTAKKVRWKTFDPGLTLLDRGDLADPLSMIVFSCRPGRYTLYAWASAGEDATELVPCVVVVEEGGPAPPPPGPDVFLEAVRAAYAADPDAATKREDMLQLAAVWRQAVGLAKKPAVATVGELMGKVKEAAGTLAEGRLKGVRTRVGEELQTALAADINSPLTGAVQNKVVALFERIATALEKVKA